MSESPSTETLEFIIREYDTKLNLAVKTLAAMHSLGQTFTQRSEEKETTTVNYEDLFFSMFKIAAEGLYQITFAPIVDLDGNVVYRSPAPYVYGSPQKKKEKLVIATEDDQA